jgi:probable phosphoglycerate mutase
VTTTTRLILLRHGETQWNVEDRYQGQLDSPLTDTGRDQARALAERLALHNGIAALYSSDLGRAIETAEIIANRTNHTLVTHSGLRERNLGVFQGLTREQVKERWPNEFKLLRSSNVDYATPEGESSRGMTLRFVSALESLAAKHPGETIAAVTHGGALTSLFRHVLGIPAEAPRRFSRANASWNVFNYGRGKWVLETWGDVQHLENRLAPA